MENIFCPFPVTLAGFVCLACLSIIKSHALNIIRVMALCKDEGEDGEMEEDLTRILQPPVKISVFTTCSTWQGWPSEPLYFALSPAHQKSPYTHDLISQAAGSGEDQAGSLGSLKAHSLLLGKLFSSFTRAVCLLQISGE